MPVDARGDYTNRFSIGSRSNESRSATMRSADCARVSAMCIRTFLPAPSVCGISERSVTITAGRSSPLMRRNVSQTTSVFMGAPLHRFAVLQPSPVAELDLPALHLEDEHAVVRDRDHEIALGFLPVIGKDRERVPAVPSLRELRSQSLVNRDLRGR